MNLLRLNKENLQKIFIIIGLTIIFAIIASVANYWLLFGSVDKEILSMTILFATFLSIVWYTIETYNLQKSSREQIEQSKMALGVELTLEFDQRFNSDYFRDVRKSEAIYLLRVRLASDDSYRDELAMKIMEKYNEIEEILDFFETIAYLIKKDVLDAEFVWHTFSYWFNRYYAISEDYIAYRRDISPAIYQDIIDLAKYFHAIETKKSTNPDAEINLKDDELIRFLEEEKYDE
jgi:hypothetical protein